MVAPWSSLIAGMALLLFSCAPQEPSFEREVLPIFEASCASAGCHATQEPSGLALTPEQAHSALVGVESLIADALIVVPFEPDESYLVSKIEGRPFDLGGEGESMPPPFGLGEADTAIIRAWIERGAPQD